MGYRSDVAIMVYEDGFDVLKQYLNRGETNCIVKGYNSSNGVKYLITFDWVKWYPELEEIANIEMCLESFERDDISYRFVRMGEDETDIEIRDNKFDFCDDIYIQIHVPDGGKEIDI